jgi:hypothetical protein
MFMERGQDIGCSSASSCHASSYLLSSNDSARSRLGRRRACPLHGPYRTLRKVSRSRLDAPHRHVRITPIAMTEAW